MQNSKIRHLGIIMDGNRRWARKRGLPTLLGHKKGYDRVLEVGKWCLDRGIGVLTVWAFSTENWNRSKEEVNYLMDLLKKALTNDVMKFHRLGIRIKILGRLKELPINLQRACHEAMKLTGKNTKGILNIGLNYGGQAEIVDAANKLIKDRVKKVTPEVFQKYLYDPGMPSPDLIIRTSGEQRTSGFLLWESAYSELLFINHAWPEFSEKDLDNAIAEFSRRNRRFGGN